MIHCIINETVSCIKISTFSCTSISLILYYVVYKNWLYKLYSLQNSCSSVADEDEVDDPSNKAMREKERRQANNVRERYVVARTFSNKIL